MKIGIIAHLFTAGSLPRVVSTPQALITKDNVEIFSVTGDALRAVLIAPTN